MSGQKQDQGGTEMDVVYIALAIAAIIGLVLYFFHQQIIHAILYIKYYELKAITSFMPEYRGLEEWAAVISARSVSFHQLQLLMSIVGNILKYPLLIFSAVGLVVLYIFHPEGKFNTIETMISLRDKMSEAFPCVNVVKDLDLVKTPIDKGPWAMAAAPIEFAKKHKLLVRDPETGQPIIDKLKTKNVFSQQLGDQWQGISLLPPHQRAVFAVLALYINYKRDEADDLLTQISASASPAHIRSGHLNYSGVNAAIKKYKDSPGVKAVIERHSYTLTVFSQLMAMARVSGIVPCAYFLWLKPVQRDLWYSLNNVGRKAVFSETGAVTAHWLAEKQLGYAVSSPMVDEAVAGLDEAIRSRLIKEI